MKQHTCNTAAGRLAVAQAVCREGFQAMATFAVIPSAAGPSSTFGRASQWLGWAMGKSESSSDLKQPLETPWVYAPQAAGASCASTLRAKCQACHWEARLRTEGMPWLSSWLFSYLTACYMCHGGFVKSHTGKPSLGLKENLEISPIYLRINPWLYRFFFKSTQWLRGLEDCPAGAFLTILVTIYAQSMLKNHEEESFKDNWDKHVWVFLKSEAN